MKSACIRLCCVLSTAFLILPLFSTTKERRQQKKTVPKSSNFTQYNRYQHGENNASFGGEKYPRKRVDYDSISPKPKRYETIRRIVQTREFVRTAIRIAPIESSPLNNDKEDVMVHDYAFPATINDNNVRDTLHINVRQNNSETLPLSLLLLKKPNNSLVETK